MRTVARVSETQQPTEHDDLYNRDHYTWARHHRPDPRRDWTR